MRLLVVRHAQAVPPRAGLPDDERPLTAAGERTFRAASRGLARLVPAPDVLLTSPLLRARQTAAFLATAWKIGAAVEPAVASGGVDGILAMLAAHPRDATVVLVGHEPTVSALVAELVHAAGESIAFEPGAAAFVEVASLARRDGRLLWFLPPGAAGAAP